MTQDKKIVIRSRAIILHDGRLLVVKHQFTEGYTALPGGHLEWGEDVKECLRREMVEELGVEPEIGRLFYISMFIKEGKQSIEFFFEVTNGDKFKDCKLVDASHGHELDEIYWVSQSDKINILPQRLEGDFRSGKMVSDEVRFIN
ncbi:hypothetical protein A3C91_03915 [Candidatus Azambacteria bacterium RIFCSPHIGHO2_02_FULL_52_12]|uniref:Nudix hydrolase domain-containing protein n=1 Tax=Candidatus Azambacteria bacterium RIFCSPLOWO2_01_FULL_46_25 TaxID=1797298 RepID=A0A1F5BUX4_9BACT|nr:MAG: hypothetical protein A3C91_03915 [Candidatus Azambacteria bacterium RIFCSPHIGHO2_02_FULL_52_12]OGD34417.1 MAG: hypothetical protein A2988_02720 [Candidatus Azambacteria bacterium RIFCSPLOWO2_01_FULL_46_25]OGD37305.1 MAG: hypothetical protein A2850_01170 [Candidatus Azambacteria bacterium RIFCSPHIGHO2_01_FULL_51_74]